MGSFAPEGRLDVEVVDIGEKGDKPLPESLKVNSGGEYVRGSPSCSLYGSCNMTEGVVSLGCSNS
jgi:hypothetical protein